MLKPWAVLISDVHYSLPTLQLADAAMRQAIAHASAINVPLIVAGDLHDTKGAMRGECVRAMLDTFGGADCRVIVLPGNHDRINEKSKPHALDFLGHLVELVEVPEKDNATGIYCIPYEADSSALERDLRAIPKGSTVVMHTGLNGAFMGRYTQDRTSLSADAYRGLRVISGHYHRRQDIPVPGGLFSYIGNPYTLNFGEALDPPKGFQVLNTDGTLTFVPTNLRKHVVLERCYNDVLTPSPDFTPGDLVKMRITGPKSALDEIDRSAISAVFPGAASLKLDLVPTAAAVSPEPTQGPVSIESLMDTIIDGTGETPERISALKSTWRTLLESP